MKPPYLYYLLTNCLLTPHLSSRLVRTLLLLLLPRPRQEKALLLQARRAELTLSKQPLRTLALFSEVLAELLSTAVASVLRHRYTAVLPLALLLGALAAGKRVAGPHTALIAELELTASYVAWWYAPTKSALLPATPP